MITHVQNVQIVLQVSKSQQSLQVNEVHELMAVQQEQHVFVVLLAKIVNTFADWFST